MKIKRIVNGFEMSVAKWANKVIVRNMETKEIVKELVFSDHIQAVLAVKAI